MGVADVIFEPHPPNFENQYNLKVLKSFLDISTSFRFSEIVWSVQSISEAGCIKPLNLLKNKN